MNTDLIPLPGDMGIEILRSEVGSTLHGTGLPGGEDLDQMGIFVETPRTTLGLRKLEQYEYRTANSRPHERGTSPRSQPGDTDLTVYTLRKWARLALNGNPSVLLPLFAPQTKLVILSDHGEHLRNNRRWFWSVRSGAAFLGYMQQQRQRMTGERGTAGRVRKTEDGAVDWKYAMHMLRLGFQGVEYLRDGHITLPVPANTGYYLRAVRRGDYPLSDVLDEAERLEKALKHLLDKNPTKTPEAPDEDAVEDFLIWAHLDLWA